MHSSPNNDSYELSMAVAWVWDLQTAFDSSFLPRLPGKENSKWCLFKNSQVFAWVLRFGICGEEWLGNELKIREEKNKK